MYFQIIKDNHIIDVCNSFGRLTKQNNIVHCGLEEAQYLLGRLPEQTLYRVGWLKPLPENYAEQEFSQIKEITEQEYKKLLKDLQKQEPIEYIVVTDQVLDQEDIPAIEDNTVPTLTYTELVEKLNTLTTMYAALLQQNRLLEDCILEMSTLLYS